MELIFDQGELALCSVEPSWSREELLGQNGLFALKDIAKPLGLGPYQIKKLRDFCQKEPEAALAVGVQAGIRVCFVRMPLFAPYYRKISIPEHREVDRTWDAARLLAEKGVFRLSAILKLLSISPELLWCKGRNLPNTRTVMGVWKQGNAWMVEMEVFAQWQERNKEYLEKRSLRKPKTAIKAKYAALIWNLEPNTLYSAAMIYHAGVEAGLLKVPDDPVGRWEQNQMVRQSLYHIRVRAGFPKEGDGSVQNQDHRSAKGWWGWRWQKVMALKKEEAPPIERRDRGQQPPIAFG